MDPFESYANNLRAQGKGVPKRPTGMKPSETKAWDLGPLVGGADDFIRNIMTTPTWDPETGHSSEAAIKNAADVGLMGMGVGTMGAEEGALGVFAGKMAKTADLGALAKAEKMHAAGVEQKAIWDETGWFRGDDGKWRFEIPDDASVFQGLNEEPQSTPFRAALKHPELNTAYPDLKQIEVRKASGMGKTEGQYLGGHGTGDEAMRMSWSARDPHSTMLHEAQHAIQAREGFAKGSGGFMLKPNTPAWEIYKDIQTKIVTPKTYKEYINEAGGGEEWPTAEKDYAAYLAQLEKYRKRGIPPDLDRHAQETAVQLAYKRAAGEVEARNVQTRMKMSPEERQAKPPWETEDVPLDQQIVVRGGDYANGLKEGEVY